MNFKKVISVLAAAALTLPLFSFMASADKFADAVKYELPTTGLAEMEIDWENPIAKQGNLSLYFVRYSGCADETVYNADEVIIDRLTGMQHSVFIEEVPGVRPSGLIIGEFIVPANGITPDLSSKGLAAGSVITEIDGQSITSVADYVAMMSAKKLGDTVKATYTKQSNATKQSVSEKINDKTSEATKALFLSKYLHDNLRDNEAGLTLGDLVIPDGMTEADFKKLVTVKPGAVAVKLNCSIDIKKGSNAAYIDANGNLVEKGTDGAVKVEKYVGAKDLELDSKATYNAAYNEFIQKYEYYAGLREEGYTVTVEFSFNYYYYEESSVSFTTGLQCDSLFVLDSQNAETPVLWRAGVDETKLNIADENMIYRWQSLMRSLVVVYADQLRSESATGTKVAYASADSKVCTTEYSVKDGKLIYSVDFSKIKIKFDIELGLVDGTFYAKVLDNTIDEYNTQDSARHIVDIEMLPFFGAANSSDDGYLIVPDGSGMMINFAENVNSIYAKEYAFSVGGSDVLDMKTYLKNRTLLESTNLPVFGLVNSTDNAGFVAYSANADAEASVIASPAGYAVDLYRTSMRFRYRYVTDIMGTNITAGSYGGSTILASDARNVSGKKYSVDAVCDADHEVRYAFLSGDSANYSGMANVYRDYLVKNGDLTKNIGDGNMPMVVDFFMATWESQILFTKIVKMTSFADAESMTKELKELGVDNIIAKFVGYTQGGYGYYPRIWPIESAVGGSGGAKSYADYAKANGVSTLFEAETIRALADTGGYSNKNDIVNYGNTIAVSDLLGNYYFLNAPAVVKKITSFISNINSVNFDGVAIQTMGNFIYQNYKGTSLVQTRTDTLQAWDGLLKLAAEKTNMLAVEGASLYSLRYSNLVTGIPVKSSEYHITYKSIPFIQMIIHGYVNYTDEPVNLFYDQSIQRLTLVEYGCLPYYKVTKEATEKLKLSNYNSLFSSEFDQWKQDIADFYAECSEKLGDVWDQPMVEHNNNGTTATVKYANGKMLLVNYTDAALEINGVTVGAYDFEVK